MSFPSSSILLPVDLTAYPALADFDKSWLEEPVLQDLLLNFERSGFRALIVGGAVRNSLLHEEVKDIDIATNALPDETSALVQAAGFFVVDDGKKFGTIRAIKQGKSFEITTLRRDIATDGRRAKVQFDNDWQADAARRDFTINAFYMDRFGALYDPLGNLKDIIKKKVLFIGDVSERIQEDYLRILRFFRFYAYYGVGRPKKKAVLAILRYRDGLATLSKERIWQEMKRLLAAPDPMRALRWMRQVGVLSRILPDTEKWGVDEVESLIRAETYSNWPMCPFLRLKAMLPPTEKVALNVVGALGLSKEEKHNLLQWSQFSDHLLEEGPEFTWLLYMYGADIFIDILKLRIAMLMAKLPDEEMQKKMIAYERLLCQAMQWEKPIFPLKGKDLLKLGYKPGKKLGDTLKALEKQWGFSNFMLYKEDLIDKAQAALKQEKSKDEEGPCER